MIAYKLLRKRNDGTLGPLFINRTLVVEPGVWYEAECHPTKGYAVRTGWHCMAKPKAPHLSKKGRVWCKVEIEGEEPFERPKAQGALWYLAEQMCVVSVMG